MINITVKELKEKLNQFPDDIEVVNFYYDFIKDVTIVTWTNTNYPYDKPDKEVCMIA